MRPRAAWLAAGLISAAALAQGPVPPGHPVLGLGYGLDHVVVAVRDLEATKAVFRDALGFRMPAPGVSGRHPSGTVNASAYFADQSYLELLAVRERELVARHHPETLAFLDRQEGVLALALSTSSARDTAAALRARGLRMRDPAAGTVQRASDAAPPPPKWWVAAFEKPAPAPLFFIEYLGTDYADMALNWAEGYREAQAAPAYRHANGALGLSAVWLVVRDIAAESALYERLLSAPVRDFDSTALGARVREFRLVRQRLFLLQALDDAGAAGRFLAERGPGVMGVSVGVRDLTVTAARLLAGPVPLARRQPGLVKSDTLLVPGPRAAGLWLEFHEARE
ncbi:MAG: VOC family protein [Rubrivivax sp.]|nr:VOC family protein [Rubrivivax sp.]